MRAMPLVIAKLVVGGYLATCFANSIARSRLLSSSTSSCASPRSSPFCASKVRAANTISTMRGAVIIRAMRTVAPPPVKMPRWPSGRTKKAEGRRLPSPHTCCRRKLKPAAHRRALYHIDDRDAAKLNLIKRLMLILGHTHEFYR